MFRFKKSSRVVRAFALGKVPSHPEFLRSDDPLAAALDAWLNAGWQTANALHGAEWEPAFRAGAIYGFLWNPGTKLDHVACGVIAPSTDAVGRAYPVVVACPVPFSLMAAQWANVPIAAEPFLDGAYTLVADAAAESFFPADIAERLPTLRAPGGPESDAPNDEFGSWCEGLTIESAWSPLFAELGGLSAAAATVEALTDALAPLVKRERPATSLLLRLPLGAGGAYAVSLWLDLVKRIGGWKQTVPTMFWGAEGDVLLLTIAPARPATIAELWRHDPHDEGVFDLSLPVASTGRSAGALSSFLRDNPGAPLGRLLSLASG